MAKARKKTTAAKKGPVETIGFWKARKLRKRLKDIHHHLKHMLHRDDDILEQKQKNRLQKMVDEVKVLREDHELKGAEAFIAKAPETAAKIVPPHPFHVVREYVDIIAVAFMVAFGVRGLFFQPFKIPTSSMQPTLFGIHYVTKNTLPNLPQPLAYMFYSAERAKLKVEKSGPFAGVENYTAGFIFSRMKIDIAGVNYTLPGEWKSMGPQYYNIDPYGEYNEGQVLCNGWLMLGDHLFVDRFSHHFTGLHRGDVIVFNTVGIINKYENNERLADKGYYYIKRLAGMPGDKIKCVDNTVYIQPKGENEFKPIYELSDKFKKIYSFKGGYHGHEGEADLAPGRIVEVPEDCYFALGDNSRNSSDSRRWGFVPRANIVGRGLFVFWPFTRRWGLVDQNDPIETPTVLQGRDSTAMHMQ